jgi:hypothetical protein
MQTGQIDPLQTFGTSLNRRNDRALPQFENPNRIVQKAQAKNTNAMNATFPQK